MERKFTLPIEPKYPRKRPKTGHSHTEEGHPVRSRHPFYPADDPKDMWPDSNDFLPGVYDGTEEHLVTIDGPCAPAADTRCYPLDRFGRSFTPNSYANSVDGGSFTGLSLFRAKDQDGAFTWTSMTQMQDIDSTLGTAYYNWVSRPSWSSCGGLSFTFYGYREASAWYRITVPTHPTDMAGITIGPITAIAKTGIAGGTVGQTEGFSLLVSKTIPSGVFDGGTVGYLPHNVATSVFIPASNIPDAGEYLYVGIAPNWRCDIGSHTCGYRWPWMDGQGNSGEGYSNTTSPTLQWESWVTTENEWGTAEDSDATGAWWDGNLPWEITSSGGSYGLDGTLYLTASAGAVHTLTAEMEGTSTYGPSDSNEDSFGDPWSHEIGVKMKARFKLTTAGSLTEAGRRYLSFEWHDGRDIIKGTVNLGDSTYAQGLVASMDGTTTAVEKDITEDSWMWLAIDTRSEDYVRYKMWVEGATYGSGEPAEWDINLGRGDDTEALGTDDYFKVVISAGNMTGNDQTVRVDDIWFCGAGDDCDFVQDIIGQGDGYQNTFYLSQRAKDGDVSVFYDGMRTPVIILDDASGEFTTEDSAPAAVDAWVTATYHVERNPDGD